MNVERTQLQEVLRLLLEAERLFEGGYFDGHRRLAEARKALAGLLEEQTKGGSDGQV